MLNPWLALDTSTDSTQRALELTSARERFLDGDAAPAAASATRSSTPGAGRRRKGSTRSSAPRRST